MARDGAIVLDWADGTYPFRLGWGELAQLQEACDAGPYVILERLNTGTWKVGEIAATIRLGLIGGGREPVAALKLVRAYVEARPPAENLMVAQAILGAGIYGAPDEDTTAKKETAAAQPGSTISPTERSDSLPYTEPAP